MSWKSLRLFVNILTFGYPWLQSHGLRDQRRQPGNHQLLQEYSPASCWRLQADIVISIANTLSFTETIQVPPVNNRSLGKNVHSLAN